MRLIYLFIVLFFLSGPASAQDMLRDHREGDPTAKLLDKEEKVKTVADYANLYYDGCIKSNSDESLNEYVQGQCACTAAKMPEFMTLKNLATLFTKTKEGDFQQGRVLLLAYLPCMYDSVYNFIYDGCFFDDATRKSLNKPRQVCECFARDMAQSIASQGQTLIPGMRQAEFRSADSVPNPLAHILKMPYMERKSALSFERCVMTEERGWNK